MQVPTFQKFRKLLDGVYPFSLKEIVNSKGDMPMPSAHDYYQGAGESSENRQIMIRKGADLKKRKRPLKRILDGDAVTMSNEVIYICDANGSRLHTLEVIVDESAIPFFRELLNDAYNQAFSFVETSDFAKRMPKELASREFPKALKIMREVSQETPLVFLYFDLKDEFIELIIRSIFTGVIAAMTGLLSSRSEDDLRNLARLGTLQFLGDDRLFSGLMAMDAIEQKTSFIKNIAAQAGYTQEVLDIIPLCNEKLIDLMSETEHHRIARIVQTSNAIMSYMESGVVAIADYIEQVKGKYNLETSITRMVLKSNPKVNMTCPNPVLHEEAVNILTKAMGYGHIIERERHIRSEILKCCQYTNCLSNRATVVCEHDTYTLEFPKTHAYCSGIGPSVNVITGEESSKMIPRCQKGSQELSQINNLFSKAMPTRPN